MVLIVKKTGTIFDFCEATDIEATYSQVYGGSSVKLSYTNDTLTVVVEGGETKKYDLSQLNYDDGTEIIGFPSILEFIDALKSAGFTGNFNSGGATPQLNTDELSAVQGANNPSATNVFATIDDIGSAGIPDAPNDANAYVRSALNWVIGYTKSAIDTLLSNKKNVVNGIVASGTNTYTATYSPTLSAYTDGLEVLVRFTNANTSTATLNLNSLGAKSIVKGTSTALVSGDIQAGTTLLLSYDGTNFVIVGSQLVNQFFDWSPTYGGFSTPPSGGANRYCLQDKLCNFYIAPTVNGTSNLATFTVTLPFNAKNIQAIPVTFCIDSNTLTVGGYGLTTAGSNVLTITKQSTTAFATSGQKRAVLQGSYEIQ